MPFTFSHPLFSVPLKRIAPTWLNVTGLVLGSMIPDMEYFMAMQSYRTIGHSLEGFLLQGVPLSVAIAIAFHNIVKPVLPKFMPSIGGVDRFVQRMTSDEWRLDSVRTWTIFLFSLFIGYWTHMFMDGWTHAAGPFVEWFKPLRRIYAGEHLFQWLQYLFSLIGVGVPGLLLLQRYKRWHASEGQPRRPALASPGTRTALWITAVAFGLVLFLGKMIFSVDQTNWISPLIVAPLTSAIFGFYVSSLFYRAGKNGKLKRALAAAASMLLLLVAFNTCEYIWTPELALDPMTLTMKPPQGVFQPLWNMNIWCWSALILVSSRIITADRRTARTTATRKNRTPTA